MEEKTIWGIHAGRMGDAENQFLTKNVIALGWNEMGDLGKIPSNRESFKTAVEKTYPSKKAGAIPNNAGQLYRFIHEARKGDYVVFPAKSTRTINIGKIVGDYQYEPKETGYPNTRKVEWIKKSLSRTLFSQGALYEIGSAMSFFQVKNYADEFIRVVEGKVIPLKIEDEQETTVITTATEEQTADFILNTLARKLKGHPFAHFVAHLLNSMGYKTRVSPPGPDSGIDIIASKDELGFESPIIKVQVKSEEGTISDGQVSALIGNLNQGEFGLFVTLGQFSNPSKAKAKSKGNVRLIDGEELVELIKLHYEDFDLKNKGILPLKRDYVPNKIEDVEDN